MRLLIGAVLAAAVVGTAKADTGYTRAYVLEPVVQFVAGKPGAVLCATSDAQWNAEKASRGLAGTNAWGFTDLPTGTIYLYPNGCRILRAEIKGQKITAPLTLKAGFAETLVHESIHVSGIVNEGVTECTAMHHLPAVLVKFFHVKPGAQLRAYMAAAWSVHYTDPPEYQTVC